LAFAPDGNEAATKRTPYQIRIDPLSLWWPLISVKGRLSTFKAPTNALTLTGLTLELRSSGDIRLEPPR